jgi:LPS sulfotransferase NodH
LFNALKLQSQNFGMWRRLKRIFAMLARERKEAKEVLWEFLGLEDDAGDEVGIYTEVLMLRKWFEEWILCFDAKSPPHDISAAWMFAVVPRLCRAPNGYLRVAG